jgi:hypothetical protein
MTVVATSTSISPRWKAAHDDFLVVGVQAAMQQAHAQAGQRAGAELFVHLHGGFQAGLRLRTGLLRGLGKQLRCFAFSGGFCARGCPELAEGSRF